MKYLILLATTGFFAAIASAKIPLPIPPLYGNNIKRTLDEVNGLKDWIKNNPMEKLLLITSELHMPRAFAMFNNKGLSLDIFSVHKTTLKLKWKYFIPSPYGAKYTMECLYELWMT